MLVACRLTQERFLAGRKVLVYAPDPEVALRFDARLWDFSSLSFVPHCRADSPLAQETPVLITATTRVAGFDDVLLNLSPETPPGFERYQEVIEVVGAAEEDATPARNRFRQYKEAGHPLQAQAAQS